jgi:hypothetical protein
MYEQVMSVDDREVLYCIMQRGSRLPGLWAWLCKSLVLETTGPDARRYERR